MTTINLTGPLSLSTGITTLGGVSSQSAIQSTSATVGGSLITNGGMLYSNGNMTSLGIVNIGANGTSGTQLLLRNSAGTEISSIYCSSNTASPFTFQNTAGNIVVTSNVGVYMTASTTGGLCMSISGSLTKSAGSFVIPHPLKSGYNLRHSFVESPTEGDNIYRTSVTVTTDTSTNVSLPDYFDQLNKNPQVFIQGHNGGQGFGHIDKNTVHITVNKADIYHILVIGTRKDQDAVNNFATGVEFI